MLNVAPNYRFPEKNDHPALYHDHSREGIFSVCAVTWSLYTSGHCILLLFSSSKI